MKTANFSLEGLLLIVLLVAGLFGATLMLKASDSTSNVKVPQQETPAMVMAPSSGGASGS